MRIKERKISNEGAHLKKENSNLNGPFSDFHVRKNVFWMQFLPYYLSVPSVPHLLFLAVSKWKKNYLESNRDFSFNKLLRHLLRFPILLLVPLLFWIFWRNRFPIYNDTHTYFSSSRFVPINSIWRMAIHSLWRMAIHWIWNSNLILFECLNLQNKT